MIECVHERKNNMFGSSSKLDVDSAGKICMLFFYLLKFKLVYKLLIHSLLKNKCRP